jgi:hypothetical protein
MDAKIHNPLADPKRRGQMSSEQQPAEPEGAAASTHVAPAAGGPSEEEVNSSSVNNTVSVKNWIRGAVFGIVLTAIPGLLGAFKDQDTSSSDEELTWLTNFAPILVYLLIQIQVFSMLARRLAFDMLEERSEDVSIREVARNSLTNQALVAALLLTVVYALLQADPPFDDTQRRLCQWYVSFLNMSIMWLVLAVIIASLCLVYTEPLNDAACFRLMGDNIMYFGEPMALTICAFFNCIFATALWTFGAYGVQAGIVCLAAEFFLSMRTYVVFAALSSWENDGLSKTVRDERHAWREDTAQQFVDNIGFNPDAQHGKQVSSNQVSPGE